MIVMILEKVPASARGELSRWLLEPHSGVFVGHVNAMVRDRLWEKCCKAVGHAGGVLQIWSTNTEQHFDMRLFGAPERLVVNLEGLKLICRPDPPEKVQKKLKATQKRAARQEAPPPDVAEKG
jgi:CRISPR-associated protein Cas2